MIANSKEIRKNRFAIINDIIQPNIYLENAKILLPKLNAPERIDCFILCEQIGKSSLFRCVNFAAHRACVFQFNLLDAPHCCRFVDRGLHSLRSFTHGYSHLTPPGY